MRKLSLCELKLGNGNVFPAGTQFEIAFDANAPSVLFCTAEDGKNAKLRVANAKKYFGAPFTAPPTLAKLEKWSDDGIARSITGKKVEPDGHGEDGSPSWLLAMGMI